MSDLPAQIMNIRCDVNISDLPSHQRAYREGHRDARHAAAELAGVEIDRLEQQRDELLAALKLVVQWADGDGDFVEGPRVRECVKYARDEIAKAEAAT